MKREFLATLKVGDAALPKEIVDAIMAENGKDIAAAKAPYGDYEELKDKAARFDQAQEAGKTELQRAQEQALSYKTELDSLKAENTARAVRDRVAATKGVPAALLTGATEEDCNAQADALLTWRGDKAKYPPTDDGGEPQHGNGGGKTRDLFADAIGEL